MPDTPAARLHAALREGMRSAGLFMALPWAAVSSAFLLAPPVLVWASAVVGSPKVTVAAAILAWLALAIGIVLVLLLGISGHVTRPLGRALGGAAAGLAGAAAVSIASCSGLLSVAVPDDSVVLLAVAGAFAGIAAPLAAAWARLRYDAGRDGVALAAGWAVALGGLPLLLYAAALAV